VRLPARCILKSLSSSRRDSGAGHGWPPCFTGATALSPRSTRSRLVFRYWTREPDLRITEISSRRVFIAMTAIFEIIRQWSELLASWVGDGWLWVVLAYLAPRLKAGARRVLAALQRAFRGLRRKHSNDSGHSRAADKKSAHCFIRFPHSCRYWHRIDPILIQSPDRLTQGC
jgi:hypothetical protein